MKNTVNKKAVGARIRKIRLEKGMTLEEFGKLMGADKGIVSRWENGTSIPKAERLKTVAKLGDMTVEELLYGKSTIIKTNISELDVIALLKKLLHNEPTNSEETKLLKEVEESDKNNNVGLLYPKKSGKSNKEVLEELKKLRAEIDQTLKELSDED